MIPWRLLPGFRSELGPSWMVVGDWESVGILLEMDEEKATSRGSVWLGVFISASMRTLVSRLVAVVDIGELSDVEIAGVVVVESGGSSLLAQSVHENVSPT